MSKALTPEASLFLNLTAFYTADVPLTEQQAIVQDAFGTFCGAEPYSKRCKLA
jgi:hypothetical protein